MPDDELRDAVRHAALAREPNSPAHPDDDQWIAYVSGQMESASAERARSHLMGCAACREIVLDLSLLLDPSEGSGVLTEAQVDRIASQSAGVMPPNRQLVPAVQRTRAWPRMPSLYAWAGAAAVLIAAIGLAVNLSVRLNQSVTAGAAARRELAARDRRISELERGLAADLSFVLTTAPGTRSAGGASTQALRILPEARTAILQIEVPPQSAFGRYQAVLSSGGTEVWSSADLTVSTTAGTRVVSIRVPATVLTGGRFTLALYGVSAAGQREDIADRIFEVIR